MSENKKAVSTPSELKDEELDKVSGGIKRRAGQARSTWCSACGKDVTPDGDGCCPDCGKKL